MGYAVGCIGLSYDDFCKLSIREFNAVCKAFREREVAEYRTAWERTRVLATITVQPHIKKKMTPQALLPFEWDKKEQKKETEFVTKEEGKRRMEEALKRKGAR